LSYRPRWYHPESPDARSQLTALICDENHKLRYEWSHPDSVPPAKLNISMNEFGILNSRKRALTALVHSVVFLGIATHGFASPKAGILVPGLVPTAAIILIAIYGAAAAILAWLVSISRCAKERIYFALCTCSASLGLLRTIFGDSSLPAAQYLRVILLSSAVVLGTWIFRSFSLPIPGDALSD
jgi:hypothetical protein